MDAVAAAESALNQLKLSLAGAEDHADPVAAILAAQSAAQAAISACANLEATANEGATTTTTNSNKPTNPKANVAAPLNNKKAAAQKEKKKDKQKAPRTATTNVGGSTADAGVDDLIKLETAADGRCTWVFTAATGPAYMVRSAAGGQGLRG